MTTNTGPTPNYSLHDRFTRADGRIWLDGLGALARLPLDQHRFDVQSGLNTAGFISGYRGSPLGGLDQQLAQIHDELNEANIVFQPGVNEDLAATAVWGTQQVNLFPEPKYDGVFALWYGKAPGLDRSMDAIRHANMSGTLPSGGVLAIVGDDPACQSSTLPSFSGGLLRDLNIPVLDPSNIEDVLSLGLHGWALSRFSGSWVGMLTQSALVDAASTVNVGLQSKGFVTPVHTNQPHARLVDTPFDKEQRIEEKLSLVHLFEHHNPVNRVFGTAENAKLTIVSSGMTYTNLRQALYLMGYVTEDRLADAGIQLLKLGMTWPIDRNWLMSNLRTSHFAFVVESKRDFIEAQLKTILYNQLDCPIIGKFDLHSERLLSSLNDLRSNDIGLALGRVFAEVGIQPIEEDYLQRLRTEHSTSTELNPTLDRKPLFCSGCPHAQSTQVPQGSLALAGIGCHYMVQWMDRNTFTFTHMGGEGITWVGQSPFTETPHVFVNLGDGTYHHSGLMAIRAAVASGVNITYKILFNDVVAMTGGQEVDGTLTVEDVVNQVKAEGVKEVLVLSKEPEKYRDTPLTARNRTELNSVQESLREVAGCTVLIYDQTCSNELRRRRARQQIEPSKKHVFINDAVCEGCGDCTRVSLCGAIEPLETPLGTKRRINQTLCNQDLSCVNGHCPALVEVSGVKQKATAKHTFTHAPEDVSIPERANIIIAGVGGTGIITLSRILSCAAWIEGKLANSLDQSGLAQKGGAVMAHIRIHPTMLHHTYVPEGNVDLLIGADPVTATGEHALKLVSTRRTNAVLNNHVQPSMRFVIDGNPEFDISAMTNTLTKVTKQVKSLDANSATELITGSSTATNMLMLGFAWQQGWIPLQKESILHAIDLNQTAAATNKRVFEAGRALAAKTLDLSEQQDTDLLVSPTERTPVDGDEAAYYGNILNDYSGARLRELFLNRVQEVRDFEKRMSAPSNVLSQTVARTYFKVLYRKDEFEVARLLLLDSFHSNVQRHIAPGYRVRYSFGSPWLARISGTEKISLGTWINPLLRLLSRCRGLRDTRFNPFGFSIERRLDQTILDSYKNDLDRVLSTLENQGSSYEPSATEHAVQLLKVYQEIRGYGRVREARWKELSTSLHTFRTDLMSDRINVSSNTEANPLEAVTS